ncbi:MAG TPA: 2-oxo acid dehydrogenase subunit E2 [Vicinamibacterales bacterium]|nr:2-oxo acid dehydrogenase subunit E2 [Vicinamibacterales bacterium]
MTSELKLPELGENITTGDVVRVLVSAGDALEKDQPVLELETDKATIEVPSTLSGTVRDVKVKQGDRVNVGQVVLVVEDGAAEAAPKRARARNEQPAEPPAPPEGAARPATQAEQPAKREQETKGSEAGVSQAPAGRQKPRGEVVEMSRGPRSVSPPAQPDAPQEGPLPPASPSVRRLSRELGVDIRRIRGSGVDGRITTEDVQAHVKQAMSGQGAAAGAAAAELPDFGRWGDIERKPMSNIRRKTAEHLASAWNTIPHVTQHDRADVTALEALRRQHGPLVEKAGGKLTITAIALKIVERAIHRFPQFNASVDMAGSEIIYKRSIHIGVAVDTERGLLVPVIRDVDRKGLIELSVELSKVSEKARAGKLSLEEMQGGGFTITNLGGIGGTAFTPIVNWPDVAILGISRSAHEPLWTGERFEPRLMLPLSLSYDHRVIDGADAARFLRWVAEAFEQPFVMSL